MSQAWQDAVDVLIAFVDADDRTPTDAVLAAARTYDEACKAVNRRLRRCQQLLQRGLRSEAVHLADEEPKLFPLVGMLDFPRLPEYQDAASLAGLPAPTPLLTDVVAAVEDAYEALEPLQALFRDLRRLSLRRAPLYERLKLMRHIAALDPASPFWEDDIRAFERAWFLECVRFAHQLADQGRTAVIQQILFDLTTGGYREEVPPKVTEELHGLVLEAARNEQARLARELYDAYGRQDLDGCRMLGRRWQEAIAVVPAAPTGPTASWAAPALEWMAAEDARETRDVARRQALAALREGVVHPMVSAGRLEKLGESVLAVQPALPEPLAGQYRRRLTQLRRQEAVQRFGTVAGVGLGTAMAAFLVILFFWVQGQNRGVAAKTDQLRSMISEGRLQEARRMLEAAADGMDTGTAWAGLRAELAAAERVDADRAIRFRTLVERMDRAAPDADVTAELDQARALTRTAEERQALTDLLARRQQARRRS